MKKVGVEGSESPTSSTRCLYDSTDGNKEKQNVRVTASPTVLFVSPFLKLSPPDFVVSKQNAKDARMFEFIRGRSASGSSTNEVQVYEADGDNRFRKGDCVRLLRKFHRSFPKHTELKIVDGLWSIVPVVGDCE